VSEARSGAAQKKVISDAVMREVLGGLVGAGWVVMAGEGRMVMTGGGWKVLARLYGLERQVKAMGGVGQEALGRLCALKGQAMGSAMS
jgi:hypothetical protein